jgi:hypothetical protein
VFNHYPLTGIRGWKKNSGNRRRKKMPISVDKKDKKWRLVDPSGKVAKNRSGTPLDGGGYASKEHAISQMSAINLSIRRKKGQSAPPAPKR